MAEALEAPRAQVTRRTSAPVAMQTTTSLASSVFRTSTLLCWQVGPMKVLTEDHQPGVLDTDELHKLEMQSQISAIQQ